MRRKISLTSAEFSRFKPSRRINGRYFTLLIGSAEEKNPKCSCVVSKKVASRAVSRNVIKRRCREVVRKYGPEMQKSRSVVLYAKSAAAAAPFSDVKSDIIELLTACSKLTNVGS